MPILDPSLQFNLLNSYKKSEKEDGIGFLINRLRIASHHINKNLKTIEALIQFKNDLKSLLPLFNDKFNCKIKENDIDNPSNKNYYKFIYDMINLPIKEKRLMSLQGSYQIFTDKFQMKLFQPRSFDNISHAWFILESPIAILCLRDNIQNNYVFLSILLEIDLMAASGYTLVLCAGDKLDYKQYLHHIIKSNLFSEIHINCSNIYLKEIDENIIINSKSFFYIYTNFDEINNSVRLKFKHFQRVNVISFNSSSESNLKDHEIQFISTKPFHYCQNGFHSNYIPIRLSNVPLFDTENDMTSSIPVKTSGLGIGYISPDDFLNWKNFRVKILFDDEANKNHHTDLFINFNDIHKVRANLYVKDQLMLAKIDSETLNKVIEIDKNVRQKMDQKDRQEFIKERIRSLMRDKKIKESLQYVAYAYSYVKSKQGHKFFAHQTQIYTAYEACKKFIFRKRDKTNKGIVFQVETGEGKTCIVCLIAAALALLNRIVHVTSSNINLSKRDFEDSYKFFQLLGIQSAVLVHHYELPEAVKQKIKEEEKKEKQSNEQILKNQKDKDDTNTNENDKKDKVGQDDDDDENNHPKEQDDDDSQTEQKVESDKESTQNKNENVILFGTKSDSYFKLHSRASESSLSECYKKEFYGSNVFRNSSRMNYSICGINEQGEESTNSAKVIFSTFLNFECFYLKMVELCPASIQKYFSEYGLLIDEADSILIDEIANGTIVSRSMNSNAIDILKYVYDQHDKKSYEETWQDIQNEDKWSICHDLITKEHVKQMYEEIKMVHEPEYVDGKKYSIEEFDVKNKKKMNRILKKVLNFSANALIDFAKGLKDEFIKDPNADEEDDDDDDDDDDDEDDDDGDDDEGDEDDDDDKNDENPKITFRHIVPFSYDRNGVLEPSKEFGGFVQQFIAIKESFKHENMIINDISMSYLYISHPIFVKLYGTVCGFTGTIGTGHDKKIFRKRYSLTTMKIPRHNPNFRVEFPMILCKVKEDRNQKIVSEVLEFHKRGNPVLVIFQDLKEIEEVEYMLINKGIKYINIFNGKNEIVKPDEIAGSKGAVSLGTNVCGRGTNIKAKGPPLHVIVSYYSSNMRVMNQAFGRTARQGRSGSYRVICLESQFFQPVDVLKDTGLLLDEFSIKNRRQQEFVDHFEKNRPWIFSGFPTKQKIDNTSLKQLREVKINVNRIIASNFVFPICITKDLFLRIQVQRIFSLFNCPNSEYTWRLFQRYLRELILESWSLMINEIDYQFKDKVKGKEYDAEIGRQMNLLLKKFDAEYLPNRKDDIIPTFMFLFEKVRKVYEDDIMQNFSSMKSSLLDLKKGRFFSLKAGFMPFALLSESGARIFSKNFKKTNFIKDPELIFLKRTVKKKFRLISITEKIDDIFNKIFMKVNEILGSKTFLKLFLRRTIAGCEFGFCLNLDIENKSKDPFCIIDRDPLLVFTIFVRSLVPILAIILIAVLIYLTSIASKVAKWFTAPTNAMLIAKKTASVFINAVASNFANEIYENVISFLSTNLDQNISDLEEYSEKDNAAIIRTLKNLFASSKAAEVTKSISSFLGDKFDIKSKIGDIGETLLQPVPIMRICAYLLLLVASFAMLFRHKRQRIEDYTEESEKYDNDPTENVLDDIIEDNQELGDMIDTEGVSSSDISKYDQSNDKQSKTYLYKMAFCDKLQKFIDTPLFKVDKEELVQKGIAMVARGIYQYKHDCIRISYAGDKRIFNQQVLFYTTNKFPSIIPFVGYHNKKKKQHIFLENKGNGTLKSLLCQERKIDLTHKLIIAYGIACAMNYLHNHLIVHRYLKPSNIFLDMNFYPYLSNFYRAKQIETPFPYHLKSMTLRYSPPEFMNDYLLNQNSFHLDVYSFGMILYNLITEIKPFQSFNGKKEDLIDLIKSGKRPEFPETFDKELDEWRKLIFKCWDEAPYRRPIFKNIVSTLETEFVKNKSIDRELFMNYKKNVLKIEDIKLTVDQ